jgi:CheY-like chemotaxis protein
MGWEFWVGAAPDGVAALVQRAYLPAHPGCAFFTMPTVILIVEDEPTVQRATCRMLELEGYACIPADDGSQALELLGSGQIPDLMVIDVRLPGMSGPELALRIHTRYPRIPVLFVSGWVDGLADSALLERMQWAFLAKPYSPETLVSTARRMLGASPTTNGA